MDGICSFENFLKAVSFKLSWENGKVKLNLYPTLTNKSCGELKTKLYFILLD